MDYNEVLAGSLADCVLADAILIPPHLLVNEKRRCRDGYGNKGRAFNYLQSESYVKMPVRA